MKFLLIFAKEKRLARENDLAFSQSVAWSAFAEFYPDADPDQIVSRTAAMMAKTNPAPLVRVIPPFIRML
jgi:hypothetical protein